MAQPGQEENLHPLVKAVASLDVKAVRTQLEAKDLPPDTIADAIKTIVLPKPGLIGSFADEAFPADIRYSGKNATGNLDILEEYSAKADTRGSESILKMLLEKASPIQVREALTKIAEDERDVNREVFETLIKRIPIKKDGTETEQNNFNTTNHIFINIVDNRKVKMFETLLNFVTFSDEVLGRVLASSVAWGETKILEILLKKIMERNPPDLINEFKKQLGDKPDLPIPEALKTVVLIDEQESRGTNTLIQTSILGILLEKASPIQVGEALTKIAEDKRDVNRKVFEALIKRIPIKKEGTETEQNNFNTINHIFINVVDNKKVKMFETLLNSVTLSDELLGRLLASSITRGETKILEILLKKIMERNPPELNKVIDEAIDQANKVNSSTERDPYAKTLQLLLEAKAEIEKKRPSTKGPSSS